MSHTEEIQAVHYHLGPDENAGAVPIISRLRGLLKSAETVAGNIAQEMGKPRHLRREADIKRWRFALKSLADGIQRTLEGRDG